MADLATHKITLKELGDELANLELQDEHELVVLHTELREFYFGCSCNARKLNKKEETREITPPNRAGYSQTTSTGGADF